MVQLLTLKVVMIVDMPKSDIGESEVVVQVLVLDGVIGKLWSFSHVLPLYHPAITRFARPTHRIHPLERVEHKGMDHAHLPGHDLCPIGLNVSPDSGVPACTRLLL